ncbi:MAG TPA: hypothetical protein VK284_10990 [Streptosporangiaceae bacterium]|nr:hypothetical protein [Streptosporangiaceae bacterium]
MTGWALIFSIVLGLFVNECCEVSPWLADKLVRRSARLRYEDPARSEERAEELAAYIKDRPGKIFKLLSALHFLGVALACRARRSKPVRDFWDKPPAGTFGDMILGWCSVTSLLCLLVLFPGTAKLLAYAGWVVFTLLLGRGSRRAKITQAGGQPTRFGLFFLMLMVCFIAPAIYLCCLAVFGLLISDAVSGESSVGLWIGLAFGFMMLNGPGVLMQEIRVKRWVEAGKPVRSRKGIPAK